MVLAAMMAKDRDAVICDMAETYRVYSLTDVPLPTFATLAAGLGSGSRIGRAMSGSKVSDEMLLQAAILDGINLLIWMQTKDGQKNRNRPVSVLDRLTAKAPEKPKIMAFNSGEDFEKMRAEILRKERGNG